MIFGLSALEVLTLYDNKLSSIQVGLLANLTSLKELFLHTNNLILLQGGVFDGLGALDVLALWGNELSSIQVGSLANLTSLKELFLHTNKLTLLQDGAFGGLGALEILSLWGNELSSIQVGSLANLTSLKELFLHTNKLTLLQDGAFGGLGALEILTLYDNKLSSIQVGLLANLTSLKELMLDKNKLAVLQVGVFDGLGALGILSLLDNELSSIQVGAFQGLRQLTYLFLNNNKLVHMNMIASAKLCLLIKFTAHINILTTLPPDTFQCMTSLEYLLLDQNMLTYIDSELFHGLKSLRELVLADNFISLLPVNVFKSLRNLHLLDLKNNLLLEIPQLFHMTNLMEIKITGNPLKWFSGHSFDNLTTSLQLYVNQPEVCLCYATNIIKCTYELPISQYFTCDRLLAEKAGVIITFILGFGAIFGNACVLVRKLKEKGKKKVLLLLIGNLAMSDLLMGIYMIIIASADAYYGIYFPINSETWRKSTLCRSAGAIAIISSEASVIFITLISIDRFIRMRYPYTPHKLKVKSTCLIALVTWILTLIIGVVASALAGVNADFYDNSHVCIGLPFVQIVDYKYVERNISSSRWYERDDSEPAAVNIVRSAMPESHSSGLYFSVAIFLGFNLVCMLIIIFCYSVLLKTVSDKYQNVGRTREMKEQIELTAKVTAIVMTDVCCWLPIILMGILVQSGAVKLEPQVYAWTVMFVLSLNSTINPILYTYRTDIYERWKKWMNKRKEREIEMMEMKNMKGQQEDVEEQRVKSQLVVEEQQVGGEALAEQVVEGQAIKEQKVKIENVEKQDQDVERGEKQDQDVERGEKQDQDVERGEINLEQETCV